MAAAKRYKVAEGTQVSHEGKLHRAGEKLDAPDKLAAQWLARGYVIDAKAKR